jgi:hypothetical protein
MIRRVSWKYLALMAGILTLSAGAIACDEATSSEIAIQVSLPSTPEDTSFKWDPCFRIDDSIPEEFGFEPETRQRRDWHTHFTDNEMFIGCVFNRLNKVDEIEFPVAFMSIQSGNMTFQTMQDRHPEAPPATIGDRTGFRLEDGASGHMIVMPGPDGVLMVRLACLDVCTDWKAEQHIDALASRIEGLIS